MDPWIESLVGTPYDDDHDCYWAVRIVLRHDLGIELPNRPMGWRKYGVVLPKGTELGRDDILFFSMNAQGLTDHVGVVVGPGDFLHADRHCGQVVCEALERRAHLIKAVGRTWAAMRIQAE